MPEAKIRELTAEEKALPYARYYYRPVDPPDPELMEGVRPDPEQMADLLERRAALLFRMGGDSQPALDYLRLRAYPFSQEVHDFIRNHDRVYVVEQNRDGQMHELLKLDAAAEQVPKLRKVLHYNGLPIDARSVTDEIVSQEGK